MDLAKLRMRVRFDYIGRGRSGKLFRGKNSVELAEEVREHKVSLIRNVPMQGIQIEDIDMSQEVYSICDEITGKVIAFAPIIICFCADSLEDALKFTMKEEFRTVEVLDPEDISLSKLELERLLLKASEELLSYKDYLEKKLDNWN